MDSWQFFSLLLIELFAFLDELANGLDEFGFASRNLDCVRLEIWVCGVQLSVHHVFRIPLLLLYSIIFVDIFSQDYEGCFLQELPIGEGLGFEH